MEYIETEKLCEECRQRPAELPMEQLLKCRACWTSASCLVCGVMRAAYGGKCLADGVCENCHPKIEAKMPEKCISCVFARRANPKKALFPRKFPINCYDCFVGEPDTLVYKTTSALRCANCAGFVAVVPNTIRLTFVPLHRSCATELLANE